MVRRDRYRVWENFTHTGFVGPDVGGNRRAEETVTEGQAVCRRIRLIVTSGHGILDSHSWGKFDSS
jgi:hypothetical protein